MKAVCKGRLGIIWGESEAESPIMAGIYYCSVALILPRTGVALEIMGCKSKKIEWTFLPPYQLRFDKDTFCCIRKRGRSVSASSPETPE